MPTTYAHDLFGKKVYHKLPAQMQEIIRENGELYRIGLHGPDILFYFMVSKNPVSRFGVSMHREKAREFFELGMEQVRKYGDKALLSYLLGFGCHYLLDSSVHPYVNQVASGGVVSHTLLEKEFDRELMVETGRDPYSYYPSDCIVPRKSSAGVIHQALPLIRTGNIYISLKMMKILTNAMVYDDGGRRRKWLGRILKIAGKKNSAALLDHFMTETPAPECAGPVQKLKELYNEALKETPAYLQELYGLSQSDKHLSSRWDLTYNG
ncbi:MAG: zinc dependent phospholipase C family protein [Eubacteriales bacterium]|nr:zinc dependent phospholipase C family protein [Eubacteriales bacterium]